jgi:hypothetical protein
MISIIKEAVLKALREWIEQEGDHVLRISRIRQVRKLLDELESEADRTIKPIDMPLWYVEKQVYRYAAASDAVSDTSWVMVREDVESDLLKLVAKHCSYGNWYGDGDRYDAAKPHPDYPGFHNYVTIGNKVTPSKRYYIARLRYEADSFRQFMIKNFGPMTWTKETLSKDINGKTIYRP